MPTVLRSGPYWFFFYSADREEPAHVHVEREEAEAKFWLDPVRLERSGGFGRAEIGRIESLVAGNASGLLMGMTTSGIQFREAVARSLTVTEDSLMADLVDGRTITVPLAWFPRLAHGTARERANWRLIGSGTGIHWPDLDEDVSVESLLAGRRSGETQDSLRRWMAGRKTAG